MAVNLFFSCDDHYVPFLATALTSIKENCDSHRQYAVRILHTGLKEENMRSIEAGLAGENFEIQFHNISRRVERLSRRLHTRDYFTQTTYYRLFIPEMFPELDKGLYLDADLVVLGDVAELYDTPLGDNLVGAVPDSFVSSFSELRQYVCSRLNLEDSQQYFNAGVLLMNLAALRQFHFQRVFQALLGSVTFGVAQDQDYLNAICRGRVTYLNPAWNTMPKGQQVDVPKLIHFNVDCKPWHSDNVPYQAYFWEYADRSPFAKEIHKIRGDYSDDDSAAFQAQTVKLIAMATQQAQDREENHRIHAEIARAVNL